MGYVSFVKGRNRTYVYIYIAPNRNLSFQRSIWPGTQVFFCGDAKVNKTPVLVHENSWFSLVEMLKAISSAASFLVRPPVAKVRKPPATKVPRHRKGYKPILQDSQRPRFLKKGTLGTLGKCPPFTHLLRPQMASLGCPPDLPCPGAGNMKQKLPMYIAECWSCSGRNPDLVSSHRWKSQNVLVRQGSSCVWWHPSAECVRTPGGSGLERFGIRMLQSWLDCVDSPWFNFRPVQLPSVYFSWLRMADRRVCVPAG